MCVKTPVNIIQEYETIFVQRLVIYNNIRLSMSVLLINEPNKCNFFLLYYLKRNMR